MENNPPSVSSSPRTTIKLSIDPRWIILALLAIIVGMLLLWKPWADSGAAKARTISVTGDTTVKAEPDEYVFYPMYEFKNADKQTAIDAAAARSTEVIAKLKSIGVADKQIKSSTNGYQDYGYRTLTTPEDTSSSDYNYTLTLTVTVSSRDVAQKVQDYLATTSPTGAVTPSPTFSEKLRKQLESKARGAATKDARAKADQSAANLGFKVGSVKSVDDDDGFGRGISPLMEGSALSLGDKATSTNLSVQPGENELSYSVTVVYYIK